MMPQSYLLKKAAAKSESIVRFLVPKMKDERKQYPANIPYSDYRLVLDSENFLTIRIYKPEQSDPGFVPPTIFHIPATAFILDLEKEGCYFHEVTGSHLAEKSGCNVVIVKHRVGPACSPYPGQVNDCYRVVKFAHKFHKILGLDIKNSVITGYCTGAMFANAISMLNSANREFNISYQILVSPLTDLTRTKKGFEAIEAQDTSTPEGFMEKIVLYSGANKEDLTRPLISPFWQDWSKLKKSTFPVTDIIVGEYDKLYGDSHTLDSSLRHNGFPSTLFIVPKGNHGSFWFNIQVIELMAQRTRMFFGLNSVEHPLEQHEKEGDDMVKQRV